MIVTLLVTQVAGLLFLFWLFNRRIRRATDVTAHVATLRAEVGGLVAELNGTTDRNVRLLEDRVASVNEIVENLDRKLRVLKRESAKVPPPVVAAAPPAVAALSSAAVREPAVAAPGVASEAVPVADPPGPAPGDHGSEGGRFASDGAGKQGRAVPGGELQAGHIARLHRSGLTPAHIAQRLGVDVGEVELVIALRTGER